MNEYLNEEGKVITEEQILASAKKSGITTEEVIELFNLKLKTEDSGNTNGTATTTANVAPTNQAVNTDSTLENGSSESQDPNLEENPFNQKYVDFSSGYDVSKKRRIYEDEYTESMAGQQYDQNGITGVYPESFEEYAESISTSLKQDEPMELGEEIVLKTKVNDVVKEGEKAAEGARKVVNAKTELSEKSDIGVSYFNLVESRGSRGGYELVPDVPRETRVVGKNKRGRETTEYVNDYETDLKNSFGSEAKYNQWKNLEKKLGDESLNKENLKDLFNLEDVDSNTKTTVVDSAKKSAAEVYNRNFSDEVLRESQRFTFGNAETSEKIEAERQKRQGDEEDFKNKYGRTLLTEETIEGRTYTPNDTGIEYNKGYKEVVKSAGKDLSNEYISFSKELEDYKSTYAGFEKSASKYDDKFLKIQNAIREIDSYALPSNQKLEERSKLVDSYNTMLKEDGYTSLKQQQAEITNTRFALQDKVSYLSKKAKDFSDESIVSQSLLKTYKLSDRFAQVMEETFASGVMLSASAIKGLGDVAAWSTGVDDPKGNLVYDAFTSLKGAAIDYNQNLKSRREQYLPAPLTSKDDSSIGQYIGEMLVNNSPSILIATASMGTGSLIGAGLTGVARKEAVQLATNLSTGAFFTMEAGGQMSQLEIAQREANQNIPLLNESLKLATGTSEKNQIIKQIEEQKDILSLSQFQKSFNSVAYGGIAGYAEKLGTLNFVNNFSKLSKGISSKLIAKQGYTGLSRAVAKNVGTLGTVGIGAGVEILEETITQLGHNLTDVVSLEQDKSLIEGLDKEFFINTAVSSLAISGPQASQNIYAALSSEIKTASESRKEGKLRNELVNIEAELKTIYGGTEKGKQLYNRKKEILKETALLNSMVVGKMADMSSSDITTVFDNNAEIRKIKREASEYGVEGNTKKYVQDRLKVLKERTRELNQENANILGKSKKEKEKIFKEAANPVQAVYNSALYDFAKSIAKGTKGVKTFVTTSEEELTKLVDLQLKNKVINQEEYDEIKLRHKSEKTKNGFKIGDSAINLGNSVYMFADNANTVFLQEGSVLGSIAAISPLHELGHIQTRKAGIIKDDKVVGDANLMIEGITSYVQSQHDSGRLSKENFKIFNERLENYKDNKEYKETDGVDADELIQLVSDFTALGLLDAKSFTAGTGVKMFVNSVMQKINGDSKMFFNLDKPQDILGFISTWQKKAVSFETSGEKEDDKSIVKSSVNSINQQLEQLEVDFDQSEIDYDVYEQQKANLESKLERAKKAEATTVTKDPKKDIEVFHGGAVKTVNDIDGNIYFSESKEQAEEYAKGSNGKVQSFKINEDEIATEAQVFDVIRELNIQPKIEGWTVDDSRLYELIDARFENAFTKEDLGKLNEALAEKGIKATRFTDTDLRTSKDTENIVVFDKSAVSQKPKAAAKPKPIKESNQALKESTAKSKKELDDIGNNPNGFNKDNPRIYNVLRGFIKSKSLVFKTKKGNIVNLNSLPGFDIDSMVSETIANMLPYVAKFDPKQNNSLFGYLMAQLNNRMKGALNTGRVTDSAFDVDVSEAKGITASETTTPTASEKPKYKNLVQQKVLSTEGLKTVRDKVISSVRVLKSKFDASVTKNVSVPPIIAEIKKDIGKQADIVLKKEMGGIKDNVLQDYLKTNKKAILENMTTFYLTKAFPEAIQKSVGGKYLLDKDGKRSVNSFGDTTFVPNFVNSDVWQGAKVDREKTSTEAKGKTSGNEIIRRVPNVSQAISDELFLSSIVGSDGKPIRGRKESLAKAIGEEIAFDIINQDLKTDGPISEALKNNQEALGVVITEHFEEELSRQIERGNIKSSANFLELTKTFKEGQTILENNGFDQLSSEFLEWKNNPNNSEVAKIWDDYYANLYIKTDSAVRKTFTKNKKEYQNKFTYLKDALTDFEEGGINSIYPDKKALALSQLEDFWNIISEGVDPVVAAIKGFNFLGSVSRTSKLSESVESNLKSKPKKVSKEVQDAFNKLETVLENVRIYSGSGSALNAVKDFVTNFKGNPADAIVAFNNSKLGEETRLAKEANILLFKYLNALALDTVLEQKNQTDVNKAFTGYLRWLETNNNNDAGLKGLAHVMGFEVLNDQAIYTDINGRKYYSKKSGMEIVDSSKKLAEGQLKINYNHSSWKAATKAMKQLIANSKPEKQKEWKSFTKFKKDQAIAASIQSMGEHQQSMGETGIRLAEAIGAAVESIFVNKNTKETAFDSYNIKVNSIVSEFGIVLNSRFISEIQDKTFGKTSKLKKSRLSVLPKSIKDNIISLEGDLIYKEGEKELINKLSDEIIKARELSATKNQIEKDKEKQEPSTGKIKSSKNAEFNKIIERNKGVAADVTYSKIVAKRMGAGIGKYKFYIPSSAEDFRLLTGYTFSGKGKQGTKDMAWFDKNLIRPYTEGIAAIDIAKQTTKNDFKALNKAMPNVAKTIGNLISTKDYTNDQAVRVYLWNKAGYMVPGLNEKEVGTLVAYVAGNPELSLYAESLLTISKSNEWLKPGEHWDVGTILSDINNLTEKGGRKAYLAEWIENVDEIFSDENLNKIKALYGKRHVTALKDSLYRMKNGTNRPSGTNAQVNKWNNWLNNSIGSIMFFNRRSALLQLLSTTNFLNWSDNNPVKAAAAFANQKQYWSDFSTLFNSAKLKQRRGGLRADVNEAEIASAAANSKNKAVAALSWLLKKGFTPTQIADSFAISSGGATFYRNRINTYLSKKDADGNSIYTEKQAEDKAFLDFIEVSDQSQQSSDPSLVSMEQASVLGRLVLAFQNTTQQYSRIMKRSGLDIIKRRQMPGTTSMLQSDFANFSKIMYYGAIQNVIFNSLSAALFALIPGFGEEEEEKEIDKSTAEKLKRITNGSIDSILRGTGVRGAVVAQIKNTIIEYFKQKDKGFKGDQAYTVLQVANLSPPIGSKLKKIYGALRGEQYGGELMKQRGFDLTANGRLNLSPTYSVLGNLSAGAANIPLDRMYAEIQSVSEMLDNRNTIYQRLALSLGFRTWDVNAKNEEDDLIKAQLKEVKKTKQKEKAKTKRADVAKQKLVDRRKAYESLDDRTQIYVANLSKNARKKFLDKRAKQLKEK